MTLVLCNTLPLHTHQSNTLNRRFHLSAVGVACMVFTASTALAADHDWISLSQSAEYQATLNGLDVTNETVVVSPDSLNKAGEFGVVELYYLGAKGKSDTTGNTLTVNTENNAPLTINLDGESGTGIYIARRNHNSYDNMDVPDPKVTIRSDLTITGDLQNAVMEKSGQATAGITVANGSLSVDGALSIFLRNMNSSSTVNFDNVPIEIPVPPNSPDWDTLYGWSSLDQSNKNDAPQPHHVHLLQAGIASGFAQFNIAKGASIDVSGSNGLLAGWFWAPNDRYQYSGTEFDLIDAREKTSIGGDLNLTVNHQGPGYGVYGLLWNYTQHSEGTESGAVAPRMQVDVAGKLVSEVTASGFSDLALPDLASNNFKEYSKKIVGLYLNESVNLDVAERVDSTVNVIDGSRTKYVQGVVISTKSALNTPFLSSTINISDDSIIEKEAAALYFYQNQDAKPFSYDTVQAVVNGSATQNIGIILEHGEFHAKNLTILAGEFSKEHERPKAIDIQMSGGDTDFMVNEQGDGAVHLTGDIDATTNDPQVKICFGQNGLLTGAARVEIEEVWGEAPLTDEEMKELYGQYYMRAPNMHLSFEADGRWNVNGNSRVTRLTLSGGSFINFGLYDYSENLSNPDELGYGSSMLTLRDFEGNVENPGIFHFEMDDSGETQQSGLLRIVNKVNATNNKAEISLSANGTFSAEKTNILVQDSSLDRNAEFELVEQPEIGRKAQLGVYLYELLYFEDTEGELAERYNGSIGDRYWYAQKTDEVAPPVEDVVSMASYSVQIAHYLNRLEDLRQRLGYVRYRGEQGLWTTVKSSKERLSGLASSSFDFETTGINLGWDMTAQNCWTFGLYGRYFTADQDANQAHHYTNGESESWGLSLYLSKAFENNAYVDLVASYDRYNQELRGVMSDQVTNFHADYDTNGYGVSVETGFQYPITANKAWILEPSVQLSYYRVEGQSFSLSNGVKIRESSVDSLTGRAGVNLVRSIMSNDRKVGEVYAKLGINYEFMGEQDIRANEARFKGDLLDLRIYYGLGATMQIRPDLYGWIQLAREEGENYTKEYEGTAGIRWVF